MTRFVTRYFAAWKSPTGATLAVGTGSTAAMAAQRAMARYADRELRVGKNDLQATATGTMVVERREVAKCMTHGVVGECTFCRAARAAGVA